MTRAENKPRRTLVRFLYDVPPFYERGRCERRIGPFKREDIANLLEEDATLLVELGVAKEVAVPP